MPNIMYVYVCVHVRINCLPVLQEWKFLKYIKHS